MSNNTLKTPVQYVEIEAGYENQRIDNFLFTFLKSIPKTRIYRLLRKGEIRVNKKRIATNYRLELNDIIRLPPLFQEEQETPNVPGKRTIELLSDCILYEDKTLFIINKPSGIPVHGGTGIHVGVIETMRMLYPQYPQLELVHRLDADTSGCLIIAKKRSALRAIHALLRAGLVRKIYWALTKNQWKPHEYEVNVALKKNHLSSGERIVRPDPEGKASTTIFRPLESYQGCMLVEATLLTGRTHQIRVHARYSQHPIAGDEKYGDRDFNKVMREKGLKRLFLHARTIQFQLPDGEIIKAEAPLSPDLSACLNTLNV